ncbi:MAG: hypothetical protein ACJ74Q_15845 [Pyrinomonadaceae bacterium]
MIDDDVLEALSSADADRVTPLMSKVYLRLLQAAPELREAERVLRFTGEEDGEGKWLTAWEQLCRHLRVSGETAGKALRWMHERGVIGYSAHKNGVGIRIFLNRAASSVGVRQAGQGQKNLTAVRASAVAARTSVSDAGFKDNLTVVKEVSEIDSIRRAPDGAERQSVDNKNPDPAPSGIMASELVERIVRELEPRLRIVAREESAREHARTREWLEKQGIPKATRVAQREAYNVLRQHGVVAGGRPAVACSSEVGRNHYVAKEPRELTEDEIRELAAGCVAMLESRGQSIEVTLSELSSEAGGFLLPADASKVRESALALVGRQGEGD